MTVAAGGEEPVENEHVYKLMNGLMGTKPHRSGGDSGVSTKSRSGKAAREPAAARPAAASAASSCSSTALLERASTDVLAHLLDEGLRKGSGSDVTLAACGTTYRLHRVLLLRCGYFREFFAAHETEEGGAAGVFLELRLPDPHVDAATLQLLLEYLYGGNIAGKIAADNVLSCLSLATTLHVPELEAALAALAEELAPQPALLLFVAVHARLRLPTHAALLDRCKRFLLRGYAAHMAHPGFGAEVAPLPFAWLQELLEMGQATDARPETAIAQADLVAIFKSVLGCRRQHGWARELGAMDEAVNRAFPQLASPAHSGPACSESVQMIFGSGEDGRMILTSRGGPRKGR